MQPRANARLARLRLQLYAALDSPNAAVYVLLIGIVAMVIATRIAWDAAEKEARLQASASAGRIASRISESLSEYEALLRVTSRMAAPTTIRSLEGIHGYLVGDTLGRFYDAATYLAFIRRVPQAGVPAYERSMQSQLTPDESGVASIKLQPGRAATHYFVESSVDISGTPPSRGMDLAEDAVFNRALRAVTQSNAGGLALMVEPAQTEKQALAMPALLTPVLNPLPKNSDGAPLGYLVLGINLHRLVETALAGEPSAAWQVVMRLPARQQGRVSQGAEDALELYSTHAAAARETGRRPAGRELEQAPGTVLRETTFGERPLAIEVRNLAAPGTGMLAYLPWLVLAGSALIAALSYLLVRRIQEGRARAESLAQALGEAAQASNRRFRDLVESSTDWIWEMDRNYRFTYVSPNTYMLFGIPQQQLLGKRMEQLTPPGREGQPAFPFPPESPESFTNHERELQGVTGETRVFESSASLIVDERGKFAGLRGMDRDVTGQRHIQRQLSALRDKLSENMRANLLEQLLTGLAHELNQPLSAIAAYSQACIRLLEQEHPDLGEIREAMKSAAGQSLLAADIVKGLRRLTAARSPQFTRIEVGTLLRNAISLVEFRIRDRSIELHTDIAPDLPYVWADTVLLTQVCLNILHNAIDAVSVSGERRIDVQARRDGTGNDVEIAFRDWGPGVDPVHAGRVFDKRFTTKTEGLGLGLTISRSIMDALNGTLTYRPAPGHGSIFTITLPFKRPG